MLTPRLAREALRRGGVESSKSTEREEALEPYVRVFPKGVRDDSTRRRATISKEKNRREEVATS